MLSPGIYSIPMHEYMLLAATAGSRLNVLLSQSPLHAYHYAGGEPSSVSEMGVAIHDAILEGVDRIVPIAAEDWRTKAAKEAREAARAEGKIPLLEKVVPQVMQAAETAKRFIEGSEIAGIFESGKPEQTVVWQEGEIFCKARCDWLSDEWHLSLKTTDGSAEPNGWVRRQLIPMGYADSLVFYERGLRAVGKNPKHRILVVEQNPPYGCALFALAPSQQQLSEDRVSRAIAIWQRCKKTGRYPGYPRATCYAEAPAWAMAEEEIAQFGGEIDPIQQEQGIQA